MKSMTDDVTDPELIKRIRYHILILCDRKGVDFPSLCKTYNVSYDRLYASLFGGNKETLRLEVANKVMEMLMMHYRLEVINGTVVKVFTSKMNAS